MLANIREHWSSLAAFGAWLTGTVGSFIAMPPALAGTESDTLVKFGSFVATGFAGLLVILTVRFRGREHSRLWGGAAAITFLLCVGTTLVYFLLLDSWTFTYDGKSLVAGSEYRHEIEVFNKAVGHELPPEDIVAQFEGEPRRVWTLQSIAGRKRVLVLVYVASIALLTSAVISMAQGFFCTKRNTDVIS